MLTFIPTAEGYVDVTPVRGGMAYNYIYQYKDHLGNVRLNYTYVGGSSGQLTGLFIKEENHYYPFGLQHGNYNLDYLEYQEIGDNIVLYPPLNANDKLRYNYKYNGKELQDELGLNMYDYGARNYDPALGRWMNIDPLAEKRQWLSPYNYVRNNPMYFIDPDGRLDIEWDIDIETGKVTKVSDKGGETTDYINFKTGGRHLWTKEQKVREVTIISQGYNVYETAISFREPGAWKTSIVKAADPALQDPSAEIFANWAGGRILGTALKGIYGMFASRATTAAAETATETGAYSVYQGIDKTGTIRYAGITSQEPTARFAQHLASGTNKASLQYRVIDGATNLTKTQARIWEQRLINANGLQKNGGALYNVINSIAKKYWDQHGITP